MKGGQGAGDRGQGTAFSCGLLSEGYGVVMRQQSWVAVVFYYNERH